MSQGCPPHRFRLPEPDGRSELPGECKYCGYIQYFRTAFPDGDAAKIHNQFTKKRRGLRTPEENKAVKESQLSRQREYGRVWREKKKQSKQCVTCNIPVGPRSKVYCEFHHERRLENYRKRYKRQKKAKNNPV